MNYTLHQLKVFLKIVETQSITEASLHLHLSQPAVSIQLKNFQEQFKFPLTENIGRRIFITDFGQEVAKICEKILNEAESFNRINKLHPQSLVGQLKIASVSTGKYVIPYFLNQFMENNKEVHLNLDVSNLKNVTEKLLKNETDFIFTSTLPSKFEVNHIEILSHKLFLVGKSFPSKLNSKTLKTFLTENPIIYRELGSVTREETEKYLQSVEVSPTKKIVLTSNEAVKQACIAGLGYTLLPLIGIKNEIENNSIELLKIKDFPIVKNWNLVWLKSKKLSSVAQAFLEYIELNKTKITQTHFSWCNNY